MTDAPPQDEPPEVFEDHGALLIVKLMSDLDFVILELRRLVRPQQTWQRKLLELLADADRQMQVFRMTEAMGKTDEDLADAGVQLGATCRKISLAIQGSRASGAIKSMASLVSRIGTELPKLLEAERQAYEASLNEET